MSFLRLAARPATLSRPFLSVYYSQRQLPARWYSAAAGLTKEAIENRVLSVFKGFEKVKAEQVCFCSRARFIFGLLATSLGPALRSKTLVLTAWMPLRWSWQWKRYGGATYLVRVDIEHRFQEFSIEIPDEAADEMETIEQGGLNSPLLAAVHSFFVFCSHQIHF